MGGGNVHPVGLPRVPENVKTTDKGRNVSMFLWFEIEREPGKWRKHVTKGKKKNKKCNFSAAGIEKSAVAC